MTVSGIKSANTNNPSANLTLTRKPDAKFPSNMQNTKYTAVIIDANVIFLIFLLFIKKSPCTILKQGDIFQNILSKPNTQNELPGNYINKLKDLSIKNNLLVLLLLGSRYTGLSSENNLELLHEYTHTPSGLLHLRIANDAPNYLYLQLIRQSFKFYMQNRFSSEYKYRILQMIRIFSKRLLPVSTRSFPLFRRPESIS